MREERDIVVAVVAYVVIRMTEWIQQTERCHHHHV